MRYYAVIELEIVTKAEDFDAAEEIANLAATAAGRIPGVREANVSGSVEEALG